MPRFEPFAGIRYDLGRVDLEAVIAPPYDVIDDEERSRLESRSPYNAVWLELSRDDPGSGRDRYQLACQRLARWRDEGVLIPDTEPGYYVYRMGFHDEAGRARQTAGVIGALELAGPGEGDVLPHEHTMPKPRGDRLALLRACQVNLSPVWVLSLAKGLSALCELPGPPRARVTDDQGVHHRLWHITQPGVVDAIGSAVASAPVVIADGHHRYETALAYQDERRAANGGAPGAYDLIMAFVVELADEQVSVRPTHRLLSGLPEGIDLLRALEPWFEPFDTAPPAATIGARMADAGALTLVTPEGSWLLRPRPATSAAAGHDLDSSRLDVALASLPPHRVAYQHGWETVVRAVEKGEAQAGVLLRPPTVAQIAEVAEGGERMPPKTTFFHPKPRTGLVFRPVPG